ncbi:MAG: NAD-dependent epimerase/dehydratase family protein [Chloroflexota bacterium]
MTRERVVAITGVSGQWGRAVAGALLAQPGLRVLGIDARPPQPRIRDLDFVKADIRNPLLVDLLRAEQVDTVVHLAWRERQRRRETDFESNVLGAMQLLGACVEAGVEQVVLRSTTAVYGARPGNPTYMDETFPVAAKSGYAFVRDMVELERFLAEFAAEFPELRIAVLRFANVVGAGVDSPFTRLLRLPVIPSLLGFDPLLQLIDFEDAVAAIAHAVLTRAGGPVNVAADEVVSLCQAAAMAGKPVLPILHLAVYWTLPAARGALRYWPLEPDYLRYPWTAGTERMRAALDFEPAWTARQALERFVQAQRIAPYAARREAHAFADDDLAVVIEDRQRPPAAAEES